MRPQYVFLLILTLFATGCGRLWFSLATNNPAVGQTSYKLVFTTQPSNSIASGATLPTGGVIEVEDNNGNVITSGALSTATIDLTDASGNGNIAGVTSVTAVGGVATIPNNTLMFEKSGNTSLAATTAVSGYGTLSTNSASISIATPSFTAVSDFSGPDDPNGDVNGNGTTSAQLWYPDGLATDGTYIYIAESWPACVIRRYEIGSPYAVTTWTGKLYNCGSTDGAVGTNTIGGNWLNLQPTQLTIDSSYLYFTDDSGCAIRRAALSNGTVTTIAGSTSCGYLDNSTGTSAEFRDVGGIYVVGTTLYVADNGNHRIRAVDLSASPYAVTTVAGNGTGAILDNSSPLSAEVDSIAYFASDSNNLYFADYDGTNSDIREMAFTGGAITTLQTGLNGSICGGAQVGALTVIGTTMYFNCQEIIESATIGTWIWSTVAGSSWVPGDIDGAAGTSEIVGGQLMSSGTDVYFTDYTNGILRVLDNTNTVTTIAGKANSGVGWVQNTTAANSRFQSLQDMVSDGTNLYAYNYAPQEIPVISMSAGSTGTPLGSVWGLSNHSNQVMAYMGGKIYFAGPCQVFEIDPIANTKVVLACTGTCGEVEGSFSSAEFTHISGITSDQQNLYIFDNSAIKKLNLSTKTVSVLSGTAGTTGCTTGTASASQYNSNGDDTPMTYLNGNIYFTEICKQDAIIQVNASTGTSSILAGNGSYGYTNSTLLNSQFGEAGDYGNGLWLTTDGVYIYVDDYPNGVIRKVDIGGNAVTTVMGSTSQLWQVDGSLSTATESVPTPNLEDIRALYYGYGKLFMVHANGIREIQ